MLRHLLCDHPQRCRLDADETSSFHFDHAYFCDHGSFHHLHHVNHTGFQPSTYQFHASKYDTRRHFLEGKESYGKISENQQKIRMTKAKNLLKEVDESIHSEELIHNPTKILGYTASPNVISSALGIILTGLVLAMEGFAGSGISYDAKGWFNY